jgi:hypothetical protein
LEWVEIVTVTVPHDSARSGWWSIASAVLELLLDRGARLRPARQLSEAGVDLGLAQQRHWPYAGSRGPVVQ